MAAVAEDPSRENVCPVGKYPAVNQDSFLVSRASADFVLSDLDR
jgi:hypothetical protein